MPTAVRKPESLLLVKQLFEDSRSLSDRDDSLSLSKAVIILDLAVEQLLNHIVLNLDPDLDVNASKAGKEIDRKTLWGNAATCLRKEKGAGLTESREVSNLHALRNLVQHIGTEPAKSEVKRYVHATAVMLSNAFKDAYDLNFESFRLWDFVSNRDLQRWLKESEDFLSEGNVEACIVGCKIAHQWILEAVRKQTKLSRMRASISRDLRGSHVAVALQKLRKELIEDIQYLENEVMAIGVGLPVMDTRRFLQLTRVTRVFIAEAGNLSVIGNSDPRENDPAVANFMLEYLMRLINLVEDGYPGVLSNINVKIFPKEQEIWQKVKA